LDKHTSRHNGRFPTVAALMLTLRRFMDTHELNETLAKLHEELTHGQQLDEEARQRLQTLHSDIQAVLNRDPEAPEPETDGDDSLGERLQEAVTDFEAAHPQFSQLIGRIADGLSNLGI
jgi:hypothetical protein